MPGSFLEKKVQNGGDNSTQIQSKEIEKVIINQGLSISDAIDIAKKLFEENFPKLIDEAKMIVNERVLEFREDLISEISKKDAKGFNKFNDPDIQFKLSECQKNYARNGKEGLRKILVGILTKRIFEEDEFEIIFLNEAIDIAPKITSQQMKVLKDLYYLNNEHNVMTKIEEVKNFFEVNTFKYKNQDCAHLDYLGVIKHSFARIDIDDYLIDRFGVIFNKGFDKSDISPKHKNFLLENKLICPSQYDTKKFQVNYIYDYPDKTLDVEKEECKRLHSLGRMDKNEIIELLKNYNVSYGEISDKFKESDLSHYYMKNIATPIVASFLTIR